MLIDLVNEVQGFASLVPQTITAAAAGTSQDFSNGTAAIAAVLEVGAVSGTTPSLTVQIEESDTGAFGGEQTVIAGMTFTAVTAANQRQVVRGLRQKRYVRANAVTVSGTSPSFAASCEILEQKHQVQGSGVTNPGGFDPFPST